MSFTVTSLINRIWSPTPPPQSVTLHTTFGDIKIEVYCEQVCRHDVKPSPNHPPAQVPKTAENFLALCASNYYDGCLFHRCIKVQRGHHSSSCTHCAQTQGFMCQTGDPTGTGKGGRSIYETPNGKVCRTIHVNNGPTTHTPAVSGRDCLELAAQQERRGFDGK